MADTDKGRSADRNLSMVESVKNRKKFRKADLILVGFVLLTALVLALTVSRTKTVSGARARITVDGKVYGIYDLADEQEIAIEQEDGINRLKIENGSIHMVEADCPDQYCIRQGTISKERQTIVCLPHKIVVEIIADGEQQEAAPDVIAQ